jgi:hypothetical protein
MNCFSRCFFQLFIKFNHKILHVFFTFLHLLLEELHGFFPILTRVRRLSPSFLGRSGGSSRLQMLRIAM